MGHLNEQSYKGLSLLYLSKHRNGSILVNMQFEIMIKT